MCRLKPSTQRTVVRQFVFSSESRDINKSGYSVELMKFSRLYTNTSSGRKNENYIQEITIKKKAEDSLFPECHRLYRVCFMLFGFQCSFYGKKIITTFPTDVDIHIYTFKNFSQPVKHTDIVSCALPSSQTRKTHCRGTVGLETHMHT